MRSSEASSPMTTARIPERFALAEKACRIRSRTRPVSASMTGADGDFFEERRGIGAPSIRVRMQSNKKVLAILLALGVRYRRFHAVHREQEVAPCRTLRTVAHSSR